MANPMIPVVMAISGDLRITFGTENTRETERREKQKSKTKKPQ